MDETRRTALPMFRVFLIAAVFILAGCQTQTPRPELLARSQEDCNKGDQAACALLDGLSNPALQDDSSTAPHQQQVHKDVDAIAEGIDKARSSQPTRPMHIA